MGSLDHRGARALRRGGARAAARVPAARGLIPGVAAYEVEHTVEFHAAGERVRLVLTIDAMHDEVWTGRMSMGWEMQLGRLDRLLAKH